jgi:hypothetical protein
LTPLSAFRYSQPAKPSRVLTGKSQIAKFADQSNSP